MKKQFIQEEYDAWQNFIKNATPEQLEKLKFPLMKKVEMKPIKMDITYNKPIPLPKSRFQFVPIIKPTFKQKILNFIFKHNPFKKKLKIMDIEKMKFPINEI